MHYCCSNTSKSRPGFCSPGHPHQTVFGLAQVHSGRDQPVSSRRRVDAITLSPGGSFFCRRPGPLVVASEGPAFGSPQTTGIAQTNPPAAPTDSSPLPLGASHLLYPRPESPIRKMLHAPAHRHFLHSFCPRCLAPEAALPVELVSSGHSL